MTTAAPTGPAFRFDARWLVETALLAALYFLTARLGLLLAMPGGHVTPVWPPSGIALAAVLLRGRRIWPGIWLGSFAANLWDFYGGPMNRATELGTSAVFALGACLAAVWGGQLVRRFAGDRDPLDRVRDVCAFLALGGGLSCLVSATVGVTALCFAGFAPWPDYGPTWLTWWLGDTAGVFVVAPLLLVWGGTQWPKSPEQWVRVFASFALLLGVTYGVFIEKRIAFFNGRPLAFVLIPFPVWLAVRFGRRGAATAAALIALMAVWGTVHKTGPFSGSPRNEALMLLELFLSVVVLTALCMAATVAERERAEAARQRAMDALESRVQERTAALTQSEALARQHLAGADRARAALLSILEDERAAEAALRESREQLRALAERLQAVREEEAARIARELHDELGGALTTLKIDVAWMHRRAAAGEGATLGERAQATLALIDSTIQSVRRICLELRPAVLDQLGLATAVDWLARDFEQRTGVVCTIERAERVAVGPERAVALFRIMQEILTNVARHAAANEVRISLAGRGTQLVLEVADDGAGFIESAQGGRKGLGLAGMRERAASAGGSLVIESAPGTGTRVTASVPAGDVAGTGHSTEED